MNKTEIKARLKDIVEVAEAAIKNLEERLEWVDTAIQKIEDLMEHLEEHVEDIGDAFDKENLIQDIYNELFTRELEDAMQLTDELWTDIEDYAEDLSETRQERMLEKYADLEEVSSKFNQDDAEYEDIENAIENIDEAIHMLKGMY